MARPRARALPSDVRVRPWDRKDRLPVMVDKAQSMLANFARLNDWHRERPGPTAGEHELRDRTLVYEIVRIEHELMSRGWKRAEAAAAARRDVVAEFGVSDDTASLAIGSHRKEAEDFREAYVRELSGILPKR